MWRPLSSFKYVLQGNLYNAATSNQFQVYFARQYIHCGNLCSVSSMFCKAIYTMRRPLFSFKYVLQGNLYNMANLFSFKYVLQGNLYNVASSVQFQVYFARQSIQCGDLCSVSSMFCKAISTMRRPLFIFKYVLQGNIYNVATSVQFQVCFARQYIHCGDLVQFQICFARQSIQCGDLCSVSSIFCKAIYTMWRPLFSFKYILQDNLYTYNAATSIQFQVCFAKQSIQCGDLCSVSSMFCKAIYTIRRPLFSFKYVLQGNLYNGATSVQFQVCFAKQSIQCGDLCSSSSMFCKAIYTMRQPLFSFKYVLQSNLYNAATSVQVQVCFARQSIQCGDLCSVSSIFCKAIYTMWQSLSSFKYVLQGNLCNAATSVQFQEYFARQSIQCGELCSVQVCFARRSIQKGDLCSVSSIFCKAIYTMRRPLFSFKYVLQGNLYKEATSVQFRYVLQGNLYNTATSVQFQVCFARQSMQSSDLCSVSRIFCKAIYTMWRPLFGSSMFCKAIYTKRRPLFSFKYILQGNLYNAATSVQFQVCFARQSIQCGDLCSVQVCFARQSIQYGDLSAVSSMFCKAIYTLRRPRFCFKYVLQGNLYNVATSVLFQV